MRRNYQEDIKTMEIELNGKKFIPEIVFIDLDGTFLDKPNKKPSRKNIEAIQKAKQWTNIIISTGRSFSKKVKKIMDLLDIEYAICQNGAVVANKQGEILLNICLSNNQIEEVIKIVKEHKIGFTVNSKFLIYTNNIIWAPVRFLFRKKWQKISKFNMKETMVNKIVVAGYLSRKKIWNLAREIQEKVKGASVKTSGQDRIVEITHETATKGKGAIFIANILNIDIKNTIHIGDSENDSTTLNKVGALIAMKDSSTKLLDVATHIGPKHKRSGVAKILNNNEITKNKK